MIKSLSLMADVVNVCKEIRQLYHGASANGMDYKDSFVINEAIDRYTGTVEDLMAPDISSVDTVQGKTSKSVNLRSDCFSKLSSFSTLLGIPESEVCRRIMYFTVKEKSQRGIDPFSQVGNIKKSLLSLREQTETSLTIIADLLLKIDALEQAKKDGTNE